MSIRAMGVRSALRSAQAENLASAGPVVSGIGPTLPVQPSAPDGTPSVPSENQVKAPPNPEKPNPVSEYLDSVSAWIPSEAVGLFLAFSGFFSVFDDIAKELVLAVVVALFTVAYAAQASLRAHKKRNVTKGVKGKAVVTAFVALIAFGAWWLATPGSLAYDKKELGLDPFWPAILLAVVALGIPFPAGWFGVEPIKSIKD